MSAYRCPCCHQICSASSSSPIDNFHICLTCYYMMTLFILTLSDATLKYWLMAPRFADRRRLWFRERCLAVLRSRLNTRPRRRHDWPRICHGTIKISRTTADFYWTLNPETSGRLVWKRGLYDMSKADVLHGYTYPAMAAKDRAFFADMLWFRGWRDVWSFPEVARISLFFRRHHIAFELQEDI